MIILFKFYALILGLLVGSFLNVVILRLPVDQDIVFLRSHCPHCKKQLKWFHNIPVFSFLFLRGHCSFCKSTISWRYPFVELIMGFMSWYIFPDSLDFISIYQYIVHFFIIAILICHFFIDLDHFILPDKLNIYLLLIVGSYSFFQFSIQHWLLGGLIGFLGPLSITWLFYMLRGKVGLGGGDIKLYGILGLYLGPQGILMNIFLSCFLGALVGLGLMAIKKMNKDQPLAFGPSIIVVAVIQIFFFSIDSIW